MPELPPGQRARPVQCSCGANNGRAMDAVGAAWGPSKHGSPNIRVFHGECGTRIE
jgi:hypothetical protein